MSVSGPSLKAKMMARGKVTFEMTNPYNPDKYRAEYDMKPMKSRSYIESPPVDRIRNREGTTPVFQSL